SSRPSAGGEEPVPVRQRARLDVEDLRSAGILRAADREWHDPASIEEEQPPDRSSEQQLPPAVVQLCIPVHLFRKRQVSEDRSEKLGKRVDGALASLTLVVREVLAFRCGEPREVRESDALFLGETK